MPMGNTLVGGLRIKEIKSSPTANGQSYTKKYTYNLVGSSNSSGILITGLTFHKNSVYEAFPTAISPCFSECRRVDVFTENHSTIPASEGEHVGYSRVTEEFNGFTIYHFKNQAGVLLQYQPSNGEIDKIEYKDEAEELVKTVLYTYASDVGETRRNRTFVATRVESDTYQDNTSILCVQSNGQSGSWLMASASTANCDDTYTFDDPDKSYFVDRQYTIREYWPYVKSETATLHFKEGGTDYSFTTDKSYEYEDDLVINPTKINFTGSDGQQLEYHVKYPTSPNATQVIPTTVVDEMLDRNIVAPRIEILEFSNGTQIDGSRLKHQLFGGFPRPSEIERYRTSWSNTGSFINSGQGYGWTTEATISTYQDGNISASFLAGWPSNIFTYQRGYLKSKTTANFSETWNYDNFNRIASQEFVDEQMTYYSYDELSRLHRILNRPKSANPDPGTPNDFNVVSENIYDYATPSTGHNLIKRKQIFTPIPGSAIDELEQFSYFDGLGRPIQDIQVAYSQTEKDVVNTYGYNDKDQLTFLSEPVEATTNTGSFYSAPISLGTHTTYDESPLNRQTSVTPPDWHLSETTYATNTSDVTVENVVYPIGSLFVQTVKDPTDPSWLTKTFSDKFGQLILERREGNGETSDTKYVYDQKRRLAYVLPPESSLSDT